MAQKHYLSKDKIKELEAELDNLKTVQRMEIAEKLAYARSLGDLSENAEYHEARNQQGEMEARINTLEETLKNAVVLSHHKGDTVAVGSIITIKKKSDGNKTKYQIVGVEEADILAGKLSYESPLGHAMMGKKKKDDFSFETPNGVVEYTIVDIE